MTEIDITKEKLKNVKDNKGNTICTVDNDLIEMVGFALENYTFQVSKTINSQELSNNEIEEIERRNWTANPISNSNLGNAELYSNNNRISVVYQNGIADSIYLTTEPGLSIKKNRFNNENSISIEGYIFACHTFQNGVQRDCDITFSINPDGKIYGQQKISDCDKDINIIASSTTNISFNSFIELEAYYHDINEILANYQHTKSNNPTL